MDVRSFLEVQPSALPEVVVQEARRASGGRAALYVVDIQGQSCRRLAGDASLPALVPLHGAIGSELDAAAVAALAERVAALVPNAHVAALSVHGRARAVLLSDGDAAAALDRVAADAAPALALATQFTDVIDRARRAHRATPAAEAQQDLLAPRLARLAGGEIAASVLPAYGVGGDWFDHADNPEATWMAVADAMGKGITATAVAVIGLAALRASRRRADDLRTCCERMHGAIAALHGDGYLTAVVATWEASTGRLAWVSCGHPPPIVVRRDGSVEELAGDHALPLGLALEPGPEPELPSYPVNVARLSSGDRLLLYSDGITELQTDGGMLGHERLIQMLEELGPATAAATVAALEAHVSSRGRSGYTDDATQLVLAVD